MWEGRTGLFISELTLSYFPVVTLSPPAAKVSGQMKQTLSILPDIGIKLTHLRTLQFQARPGLALLGFYLKFNSHFALPPLCPGPSLALLNLLHCKQDTTSLYQGKIGIN